MTAITWPAKHPNEVVFSLAEGRVKVGQLKSNKAATLFQSESYVVSLCAGMEGRPGARMGTGRRSTKPGNLVCSRKSA